MPFAVVLTLALLSAAASCPKAPRHTAHLSLNAFAKALAGVQQGELALFTAGKVPAATHATITAKIVHVATLADEAQTVLDAWVPGQPVPQTLGPVMVAAKDLMRDVTALLPLSDDLRDKVQSVYDAITDVLILIAGGA